MSIDPRRILLVGDLHGDAHFGQLAVRRAQQEKCDIILQLGDFAAFGKERVAFLDKMTSALKEANLHLWWVDGNHEDYDQIEATPLHPATGLQDQSPWIHHIPRGHRWTWNGVRFLGLGGAYSIDQASRVRFVSWWPQEEITYGQALRAAEGGQVDVMVTHDVPWGVLDCYGPGTGGVTDNRFPGSVPNRKRLRQVVDETRPRLLVHGHTHYRNSFALRLATGHEVQVEGLGCNGMGNQAFEVLNLVDMPQAFVPANPS